ncbi:MAG: hypothetical protein MUF49_23595 [Oculatellaceae cyanobacterium Prado106]|jgi:hypothetical protein|nr:hypothetical protein [Oculatellaceae cyanobacterium Prado106]
MMQDLSQMTSTELKRFISEHRNNDEAFRAALEVLMERCDPDDLQPFPFSLENPEAEVGALLRKKIAESE